MASSDITTLMFQMLKKRMQEQQHVAQEILQKQQRAADKRQRQFMSVILEKKAYRTPTATRSTIGKSPPIKFDFGRFTGNSRAGLRGSGFTGLNYRRLHVPMRLRKPLATKRSLTASISIAAAPTRTNYTKCDKPWFHWSLHAKESRSIS